MKKLHLKVIFASIVWLGLSPSLFGRIVCSVGVGPAADSIPINAAFLVETCGCTVPILEQLGIDKPVSVVSDHGDTIRLRPMRYTRAGQEQLLLILQRPMTAGHRYGIYFQGLQDLQGVDLPDGVTWMVKDDIYEEMVTWGISPSVVLKDTLHFQGKQLYLLDVTLMPLNPSDRYWVMFKVENIWKDEQYVWLEKLNPFQFNLTIGYPESACGPTPQILAGEDYRITITLVGLDGALGRQATPLEPRF